MEEMTVCGNRIRIERYTIVDSTNNIALKAASDGQPGGLALIADGQTAGRGRLGRSFYSPAGTGLYMSFLLRPEFSFKTAALVTPMAAVAAALAVERVSGKTAGIKWVNDIIVDGRKICGINCETSFKRSVSGEVTDYMIIGAGFNLTDPLGGFPEDILSKAGSIWGREGDIAGSTYINELKSRLEAAFIEEFFRYFSELPEIPFYEEYRSRSVVLGRTVRIIPGKGSAAAVDIDRSFRLVVRYPDGREEPLSSGEVSVRTGDIYL